MGSQGKSQEEKEIDPDSYGLIWQRTTYAFVDDITPPPLFEQTIKKVCDSIAKRSENISDVVSSPAFRHLNNLASRFGHYDYYAASLKSAVSIRSPWAATAVSSAIWIGFVCSAKSYLDAVAISLNWSNCLGLPAKKQDLHRGPLRALLLDKNPRIGAKIDGAAELIREVVDWRDWGIHRTEPLLVPHWSGGKDGPPDGTTTKEMPIKLPAKPGIGIPETTKEMPWMDPLDLHARWRPKFAELLVLTSYDLRRAVDLT